MSSTQDQYEGIQTLRFVAALLVVLMHSTHYASERLLVNVPIFSNGGAGVDIFFVISGFVMVISSKSLTDRNDGWKLFIVRRLIRIVPLYWLLLSVKVLTILFLPSLLRDSTFDPIAIISSYLFLPSYNNEGEIAPILYVGWSLNFEMFFYSLLAIAMALRIDSLRFITAVFTLLCLLAIVRTPDWPVASFYFDTIVLEFALGMMIARAIGKGLSLPAAVCIGLILIGSIGLAPTWEKVPTLWRPLVWGIPAAMIVMGVVGLEPVLKGHYPQLLLFMGSASYALYLVHPLIAPLVPSAMARLGAASAGLSILLSVIASIFAAALVYHYAETRATRFLRKRLAI